GETVVELAFEGGFNDQLVGFYLSRFTDADGNPAKLATTQFEATHARKAFPCWDEPAAKATFDITIVAPAGTVAVANTAETVRTELDDGSTRFEFATTMKMSTYLVAFVIGPLEITDTVDVDGVPLRVVHVPGRGSRSGEDSEIDLTSFALECGAFGLRYFSDYFGIPYPGDKVDLIAIPDFAFGAMENLGCITFREALLLIDPAAATQAELQRCADVIFHELAHMWFGDLVTMKWWNGLWLNEAFATFMEMRCTDAFRPHWQRWTDFGLTRTEAFGVDALASTRPIEFEVVSPEDAEGMFDILTYEKGAAVVRMLEQYLGEEPFRAGIRRYMAAHSYGNAETTDLWDAIEAETSEPVRRIMDSWIFQGGFPLLSVELAPNGTSLTIAQDRYSPVGGDEAAEQTWAVPVRYRYQPVGGDPVTATALVDGPELEIALDQAAEWVVVNAEGASFVRVAYTPEALDQLASVALEVLTPVERFALVDDAWAAVLADSMTAAGFLDLLESLTAEIDRSVWQRMISGFGSLDRLVTGAAREQLQGIVHDAVAPALAGLTLTPQDDDDDRTRQLRGDLIRAMGVIGNDPEIQDEAKRTVSVGRRDPELVESSIMAAAVDVTARLGDDADLADYLESFATAGTPQEELRYLYATADFPEWSHLEVVMTRILAGEIRSQNAPFWIHRALSNRPHQAAVWAWVTEHWDEINELFPSSSIVRLLGALTVHTGEGDAEATAAFFETHPVPQGSATLAQILERQRVASALARREEGRFGQLLAADA
ncbi:MAG: M1 family metallopeptidase, partial [Acidimicrobiales bacterium]